MKSREEKALAACKEYDRLMNEIKRLTKVIGEGISACVDPKAYEWVGGETKHNPHTHLHAAFALEDGGDYWDGPRRVGKTPKEVEEILAPCLGCRMAYKYVRERKEAKKQLGIIKRTIRAIGRAA